MLKQKTSQRKNNEDSEHEKDQILGDNGTRRWMAECKLTMIDPTQRRLQQQTKRLNFLTDEFLFYLESKHLHKHIEDSDHEED